MNRPASAMTELAVTDSEVKPRGVTISVHANLKQSKHDFNPGTSDRIDRLAEPTHEMAVLATSALLLQTLPVPAQRDYNATGAEGHRRTSAKPQKSTSFQQQPNVR
jgi:hypothetical protein